MRTYSCEDIANYFLISQAEDDNICPMKIQKLLYYSQGFHLALYDEPLFGEQIEAWTHGPVVPELYYSYKRYGRNPIDIPKEESKIDPSTIEFLDEIYNVFGRQSAWDLREATHREPPFQKAEKTPSKVIDRKDMAEYFKTRIKS